MDTESILLGQSPAVKRLRKEIPQLAARQEHILVRGDLGSGKATVSRIIHASSPKPGTLITLNPGTATDIDIKEAFERSYPASSTVLIQEIEEFSFVHQSLINSSLQQLPKRPFLRVIVTTKETIGELEKKERVIDSLLKVMKEFDTLFVPSLNQRRDDIPLLIEQFVKNACESTGTPTKALDTNAMDFLTRREWKQNVRELKAVIERSVYCSPAEKVELPDYLIDEYSQLDGLMTNIKQKRTFSFDRSLANLERTLIERTLDVVGYNQSKAAAVLNLSEANLRYRLKKFRIPTSREK